MTFILNQQPSIADHYIAQLRDKEVQQDRWRFRQNMERIGNLLAYEMSKQLTYEDDKVQTTLGEADTRRVQHPIVLGTILRAGLPFH